MVPIWDYNRLQLGFAPVFFETPNCKMIDLLSYHWWNTFHRLSKSVGACGVGHVRVERVFSGSFRSNMCLRAWHHGMESLGIADTGSHCRGQTATTRPRCRVGRRVATSPRLRRMLNGPSGRAIIVIVIERRKREPTRERDTHL